MVDVLQIVDAEGDETAPKTAPKETTETASDVVAVP
jgi:hypothetical protein